jgi:hypothetical protein
MKSEELKGIQTPIKAKYRDHTDDISGKIQECNGENLNFPVISDNKIYVLYNPDELMNSKSGKYASLPSGISDQLLQIQVGLNLMDNPILLIGSIKKNIEID